MNDHDRDAILARRALFITTALAGIACTTHEPPEQPDAEPVQHSVKSADGERPLWSEVMAAAPPLEVPQGVSEDEKRLLSYLESFFRPKYAELEKVWTALPVCAPSQADCEAWAASVDAIAATEDLWTSLCGYGPAATNTFVERERAHLAYVRQVGELLLADLDAAAKAHTAAADETAWVNLRLRNGIQARPCLDCMSWTAEPVLDRVSFDDGQAALAGNVNDEVLQRVVEIHKSNRKTRLSVRGHADPSEPDADGLAKRRADAVAAALIKLGVGKAEIDVRGYGATLPLTRIAAQAEQNRRVDFEVVEP